MTQVPLYTPPYFRGLITTAPSGTGYSVEPGQTVLAETVDIPFLTKLGFLPATPIDLGSGPTIIGIPMTAPVVIGDGCIPQEPPDVSSALQVVRSSGEIGMSVEAYGTGAHGTIVHPTIIGRRGRGTAEAPLAVKDGDTLLQVQALGYTGTQFFANGSSFFVQATQDYTDNEQGSRFVFAPVPTGTTLGSNAMQIEGDGNVLIGTDQNDTVNFLQVIGGITGKYLAEGITNNITLTGSTQATAFAITSGFNVASKVNKDTGARLPEIGTEVSVGTKVTMFNDDINTGTIYGAGAQTVDNEAGSVGVVLSGGNRCMYIVNDATSWISSLLGKASS